MQSLSLKTTSGILEYTIIHRSRVKKRLHMELGEDGGLVVVAPKHWSKRHINSTLAENRSRVERFLVSARRRQLKPLTYVQGELQLYLGERYPLAINHLPQRRSSVVLTDSEILVGVANNTTSDIQVVLQGWYQQRAEKIFSERLQLIARRADWARGRSIPLKLRRMKRTWGNCSSSGVIKLNTHLIKAPLQVIDSVVAHELCHLQEMNHGKRFYALLRDLNPNWQQDRLRLRAEGYLYLL